MNFPTPKLFLPLSPTELSVCCSIIGMSFLSLYVLPVFLHYFGLSDASRIFRTILEKKHLFMMMLILRVSKYKMGWGQVWELCWCWLAISSLVLPLLCRPKRAVMKPWVRVVVNLLPLTEYCWVGEPDSFTTLWRPLLFLSPRIRCGENGYTLFYKRCFFRPRLKCCLVKSKIP